MAQQFIPNHTPLIVDGLTHGGDPRQCAIVAWEVGQDEEGDTVLWPVVVLGDAAVPVGQFFAENEYTIREPRE